MAAQIPIVATTSTPGIARNSKKRPASPSHNGSSTGGYSAGKKKKVSASGFAQGIFLTQGWNPSLLHWQGISMDGVSENKMVPSDFSTGPMEKAAKPLPFKDPNFVHSGHGGAVAGKKNRTWKNLKQILASERALPWQLNDPNYFSIDAPPSFKPAKKYSDVSGLLANYTDPQSKLRFSTIEEFSYIRRLPSDVVTGYLALRKATSIVP
ncbi:INO80 complex subunit C isoform X1 [Odocoileus virginianus]|uniref:INO80 complex subunit C isoform X1 n=1 Tax=Odocoileus virginianus TaxID=9874 RepID=A0ABM4H049_ODOVR